MSEDYSIYSHSGERHDVSWPDGASVTVLGPWRLAADMAAGRAIRNDVRYEIQRLRDVVGRLEQCASALGHHRDALHAVCLALDEVKP